MNYSRRTPTTPFPTLNGPSCPNYAPPPTASCSGKCRPLRYFAGAAITFLLPTNYRISVSTYLPAELRQQLVDADDQRCAYFQTTEANTGQPMVVDHIVPEVQGGRTTFDNLCFACRRWVSVGWLPPAL